MFAKPVLGDLMAPYGWRVLNGVRNFHNGLDYGWLYRDVAGSRRVYSVHPGTVVDAAYSAIAGNYVLVDVGGGRKVRYIHLESSAVTVGQKVGYSTPIGVMGDTGSSTTQTHLHLDLFNADGTRTDPLPLITLPFGYAGITPAGELDQSEEDDMYTEADRQRDNSVYAAIFNGGPSMPDGGASLGVTAQQTRAAVASIQRYLFAGGKEVEAGIGRPESVFGLLLKAAGRPVAEVDEVALAAALAPTVGSDVIAAVEKSRDEILTALAGLPDDTLKAFGLTRL